MPLPNPSPMTSYWLSAAPDTDLANHRTTDHLPPEADVVIIGSGFAGASAAYTLLKDRSVRPSVLILEARATCTGATGRNGGHLKPDLYFNTPSYVQRFGARVAADLTCYEIQQVSAVKKLVEEERIDCDLSLTRGVDVYLDPSVASTTIAAYTKMKESGYKFPDDLHFISDPKQAETVTGVKGALAAFTFTAGSLWPYKMITHLLRRALEWGANLQTNTTVTSISDSPDSAGRWALRTPRGVVKAKKVIFATNAYTSYLLPEFTDKITPARGVCCRIAVPDHNRRPAPHLNNTYSIRFRSGEYDYLIPRPTDGSIVVGGAKQVVLLDENNWNGNTNDSELIPGAKEYFQGYMQRTFHGWEDSGAEVSDIWTGIMGYSSDLMPWVGEVPGRKGVFVAAGFTGHGMPRLLGCGEAVGKLVTGDESWLPAPYWITKDRLEKKDSLVKEYMNKGAKAKL